MLLKYDTVLHGLIVLLHYDVFAVLSYKKQIHFNFHMRSNMVLKINSKDDLDSLVIPNGYTRR